MEYRSAREALENGEVSPVYLVFGEEVFLIRDFVRELTHRLGIEEGNSLRYQRFEGQRIDEALAACMTPSFDGLRRLVLLENPPALEGGVGEDLLLDYVQRPDDGAVLVCIADKVDRRRRAYSRFKSAREAKIVECSPLRGRELARWMASRLRREGKSADPEGLRILASMGVSLGVLDAEIRKLLSYVGDRNHIEVVDVMRVVNVPGETSIFSLVDAVGSGDAKTAVTVTGEILDGGADPLMILGMVARQIRLIWHVKHELQMGRSPKAIARALGQHPFVVEKCARQSGNFEKEHLERHLRLILETDLGIKRGVWSARLAVERLVAVLASPGLRARAASARATH
ncbi:MAG: DNA polymerase III subunit delta [Bacillota bacterium]